MNTILKSFALFVARFVSTLAIAQAATAPDIVQATKVGDTYALQANADGTQPFTFQWYKGTQQIPGATAQQFVLVVASTADAAAYKCVIMNSAGSAITNLITVTVTVPILPPSNATATSTKK